MSVNRWHREVSDAIQIVEERYHGPFESVCTLSGWSAFATPPLYHTRGVAQAGERGIAFDVRICYESDWVFWRRARVVDARMSAHRWSSGGDVLDSIGLGRAPVAASPVRGPPTALIDSGDPALCVLLPGTVRYWRLESGSAPEEVIEYADRFDNLLTVLLNVAADSA